MTNSDRTSDLLRWPSINREASAIYRPAVRWQVSTEVDRSANSVVLVGSNRPTISATDGIE